MSVGARWTLAGVAAELGAIPRWRATSVVLAAALLWMPVSDRDIRAFAEISMGRVEILVLLGVCAGWLLFDRLAALRVLVRRRVILLVAVVAGGWLGWRALRLIGLDLSTGPETIGALALVFGSLIRGTTDDRRSVTSLVVIGAVTSWLTYDLWRVPYLPLRDIELYLGAGTTALAGTSPYLTAPLAAIPALNELPFVYPPFTIPLFELLALIPRWLAESVWVAGSIGAVVGAFWLLGVRGRWLLVLLAWPIPAQGIAVGNVASYTFFLYCLGFRVGASIVLSGIFKVQSLIPGLWLLRERRWREVAVGIAVVAVLAIASVLIVGLQTWTAWPTGLTSFQASLIRFPSLAGVTLARWHGEAVALAITVVAVGFALLRRGRNGLARLGLASVVGSPTLSLHGLSPLLAGALILGPELLWFFFGLGPWYPGFGLQSAWFAMAFVGLALLVARGGDLRPPGDLSPARADVHPAATAGQVWPERD